MVARVQDTLAARAGAVLSRLELAARALRERGARGNLQLPSTQLRGEGLNMTRINLALRRKRPIDSGVAAFAGICAGALLGAGIWVIIILAVWAVMGGLTR